jgi:catalase
LLVPGAGAKYMTDDEAVMAGEKNMRHSHATHDLFNAIASGDYPEWTWTVQVMDMDTDPATLGFDPLDDTKVCLLFWSLVLFSITGMRS